MKQYLTAGLLMLGLGAAVPAGAATLGLTTAPPTVEASFATVDFVEFGPDGDLSAFGAEVDFADGVAPVGLAEIGFGIGFSLADPVNTASGGFDVFDDNGLFLSGDVAAVGFTEDIIEVRFNNLAGLAAADFGASVLALIAFDDPLGADPFAALVSGDSLIASVSISSVAPIPLPAGLALLLTGLAGFGVVRLGDRRGARSATV